MNTVQKIKNLFPPPGVCLYYLLSSVSFCYLYFHDRFSHRTFYEENIGGIYWMLSFTARVPNQFRLFVPFMFKGVKTIFPFVPDTATFLGMIIFMTFFILIFFYNVLNFYFADRKINYWLAFIILYPMFWHYQILNQMFDFTDYAYFLLIIMGYYFIMNKNNKLLLLIFTIGTLNHDSIGFLILMYLLYNYKDIFKPRTIIYTSLMMVIFILVKIILQNIFISNPGVSFRFNYVFNYNQFFELPFYKIAVNLILYFGGMHLFVLYFFISGKWKRFKMRYILINLTILPYVVIIFLIHTTFEARNYIVGSIYILFLFLLYFSTQKNTFLKPLDEVYN
jgi:hypothetical protein